MGETGMKGGERKLISALPRARGVGAAVNLRLTEVRYGQKVSDGRKIEAETRNAESYLVERSVVSFAQWQRGGVEWESIEKALSRSRTRWGRNLDGRTNECALDPRLFIKDLNVIGRDLPFASKRHHIAGTGGLV